MITAGTYNAPNWVDLATNDIDGSINFYQELLGWDIEKSETPMGDYFIGLVGGSQVAGMMSQDLDAEEMPPMWTTFFNVADLDASVNRVDTAGGSVLTPPFDIPDARVSIVADAAGAMFGMISGMNPEGIWMSREPGRVCWVETLSRDAAASEGFYTAVFDWKAETTDIGWTRYTVFTLDGDQIAGMMMTPDSVPREVPSHWAVYFNVVACVPIVEKTLELGGKVLAQPMETDVGRFAVLEDPQGAFFHVMEFNE